MGAVSNWQAVLGEGGGWHSYLWALRKFEEFTGKKANQLIADRDGEIVSLNKEERLKTDNLVISFHQWMRSKKYLPGTCNMAYNAIRSFYSANDVPLTKKKPKTFKGTPEKLSMPIRIEDIPRMISAANSDIKKATICFLAESGCRPSILTALKVGDIHLPSDVAIINIPAVLRNYRGENVNKTQISHRICVTHRTLTYLAKSISTRKAKSSDQLFPFSIRTINNIVEEAARKLNLKKITPRSFRKTFNDAAIAAKIPYELKEFLLGHKIDPTQAAYFSPESPIIKNEMVKSYNKIIDNLGENTWREEL